jgi:hypothetical protein
MRNWHSAFGRRRVSEAGDAAEPEAARGAAAGAALLKSQTSRNRRSRHPRPRGRRVGRRSRPGEGALHQPSSVVASQRHLLPQGEKGPPPMTRRAAARVFARDAPTLHVKARETCGSRAGFENGGMRQASWS